MPANLKHVVLIVLVAIGVIFAFQNVAKVEVQFLLWSVTLPRAILILAVLALGVLIGWILQGIRGRKARREP